MTDGLESCPTPWCGPEHEKYTWQGPDDLYCVICDGCQVEGPHCENEGDAQDAWNTRASLAAQDGLVEAAGKMWGTLTYIRAASDCDASRNAADEVMREVEPALSAIKGDKS